MGGPILVNPEDLAKVTTDLVVKVVDVATRPLRESTQRAELAQIQQQSETAVQQFKARHPGEVTKEVEARMVELTKLYNPKDVTEQEYLDGILTMATAGKGKAAPAAKPSTGEPGPAPSMEGKTFDQAFDEVVAHVRGNPSVQRKPRLEGGSRVERAQAQLDADNFERSPSPARESENRLDAAFDKAFAAARKQHLGR